MVSTGAVGFLSRISLTSAYIRSQFGGATASLPTAGADDDDSPPRFRFRAIGDDEGDTDGMGNEVGEGGSSAGAGGKSSRSGRTAALSPLSSFFWAFLAFAPPAPAR